MKKRCDATLISALLLSLCLVTLIPGSLKCASTWRELYVQMPGLKMQNYLMPMGLSSLGFVMIGLIVLWTGYRKNERWAWFVMLIILLFFIFPGGLLPLLLQTMLGGFGINLSGINYYTEMKWVLKGNDIAIGIMMGLLIFPVMLVALLLPIKAFFWRHTAAQIKTESLHEQA